MTNNITPDESSAVASTTNQLAVRIANIGKGFNKNYFSQFFFHCIEPWINETPNCENI